MARALAKVRNQHKYPASTPFLLLTPIQIPRFSSRVLGYLWFFKRKETLFLFKNRHKYPHKYPTKNSSFVLQKLQFLFTLGGYLRGFSHVGGPKQVTFLCILYARLVANQGQIKSAVSPRPVAVSAARCLEEVAVKVQSV